METDERDAFSKPKPSKRKSLYSKVKGLTKFEIVGNHAERSSGRSEKEGISCKNDTDDPSISADNEDKAQSDKSDHSDQGLSAVKNLRLNQKDAHNYSMEEDSAAVIFNTVSTNTKEASGLREQKRRQMNRGSAKRSRSRKQQCEKLEARIEALKADSHELCLELKNLSEECNRFDDENQQIKDELIRTYGPSILHDLNELMQK